MSPKIQPSMSQAADKPLIYVKPINPMNIYPLLFVAKEDTPTKKGDKLLLARKKFFDE